MGNFEFGKIRLAARRISRISRICGRFSLALHIDLDVESRSRSRRDIFARGINLESRFPFSRFTRVNYECSRIYGVEISIRIPDTAFPRHGFATLITASNNIILKVERLVVSSRKSLEEVERVSPRGRKKLPRFMRGAKYRQIYRVSFFPFFSSSFFFLFFFIIL